MPRGDAPGTEPNSSLQLIQACPQGFPHYCTTQGGQNYCCSIPARHMCLSTMTCFGALTDEQFREEAARCPIWIDCG